MIWPCLRNLVSSFQRVAKRAAKCWSQSCSSAYTIYVDGFNLFYQFLARPFASRSSCLKQPHQGNFLSPKAFGASATVFLKPSPVQSGTCCTACSGESVEAVRTCSRLVRVWNLYRKFLSASTLAILHWIWPAGACSEWGDDDSLDFAPDCDIIRFSAGAENHADSGMTEWCIKGSPPFWQATCLRLSLPVSMELLKDVASVPVACCLTGAISINFPWGPGSSAATRPFKNDELSFFGILCVVLAGCRPKLDIMDHGQLQGGWILQIR